MDKFNKIKQTQSEIEARMAAGETYNEIMADMDAALHAEELVKEYEEELAAVLGTNKGDA